MLEAGSLGREHSTGGPGLEQHLQILDEFSGKRILDGGHADHPRGRSRRGDPEF